MIADFGKRTADERNVVLALLRNLRGREATVETDRTAYECDEYEGGSENLGKAGHKQEHAPSVLRFVKVQSANYTSFKAKCQILQDTFVCKRIIQDVVRIYEITSWPKL